MKGLLKFTINVVLVWIFIGFISYSTKAQTVLVNYDFVTNSSTPCTAMPVNTASGVNSTFTTGGFGTCTNFAGTAVTAPPAFVANANNDSVALRSFPNTSSTGYFQFALSGTSLNLYSSYKVFFQSQRTASVVSSGVFQYSTDGTNFTDFQTITIPESFGAFALDLSSGAAATALNNQSTVFFRLVVGGATSTSGNVRIDNF